MEDRAKKLELKDDREKNFRAVRRFEREIELDKAAALYGSKHKRTLDILNADYEDPVEYHGFDEMMKTED